MILGSEGSQPVRGSWALFQSKALYGPGARQGGEVPSRRPSEAHAANPSMDSGLCARAPAAGVVRSPGLLCLSGREGSG